MTLLPQISPRHQQKRHDAGHSTSGFDATQESVSDWTPHDVAEWLYLQGTKEDHAHTFLLHNIDGPALLGLTREKLLGWKVKPVDCNTILQGIQDLRRIEVGQVGWQAQEEFPVEKPRAPAGKKPNKPTPRQKQGTAPADAHTEAKDKKESNLNSTSEEADGATISAGPPPASADSGDWALTTLPGSTLRLKTKPPVETQASQQQVGATSSAYLRKVMGDLHASERVPLWKEEMVERVKRAAQKRREREAFSQSAPASARISMVRSARTHHSPEGSSTGRSMAEPGAGKRLARDVDRKLFWYQDAIHEQELQSQLLEQKIHVLQGQVQEALDRRKQKPALLGVGAIQMEREIYRRQQRELARLQKNLVVSETRVADAERVNSNMMDLINNMRRGRSEFLLQLSKLTEREAAMAADMKHFAQVAHASLDEKEKTEARLKRQQFDYKVEGHHFETVLDNLQTELHKLEEKIHNTHHAEEELMQKQRQSNFRTLKAQRDSEQKRELKLGCLQNHVRGQEMDFQRLHRIMGVKFTPEKPESVVEIVSTSLKHEQRNASLLHFVGVQTAQMEALQDEVRALEDEEAQLLARAQQREEAQVVADASESREEKLAQKTLDAIDTYESTLQKLCPIVVSLCDLTSALSNPGELALKGCRPDTLADHLRLVDDSIKDMRNRAASIPTVTGNEWLRDFLEPKTVNDHPNVFDLRKELETAAQKQKEQKAYADSAKDGGPEAMNPSDEETEIIVTRNPSEAISLPSQH